MTSQKGVIIATIVAALITAGVTLYVYFDGKDNGFSTTETTNQKTPSGDEDEKNLPIPRLTFPEVFITPVDTEIPSSFFAEIANSGTKAATTFDVSVDFGEATPDKCELVSSSGTITDNSNSTVIKQWQVSELAVKQSLYLVCSLNAPFFKALSVGGGNLENDKQLTFLSYKAQREEDPTSFFEGLLKFVAAALSVILLFYFFLRLIGSLG